MSRTVFITGASSGIGLASAKLFFEKGWNVVATMRLPDEDTELGILDPARVLILRLDLQDYASIEPALASALAKFPRIDLLINNAGYGQDGLFETLTRVQIQDQFNVNVFGVMDVTRAILPHFRAHGGGGIINISSGAGVYGLPMISIYCASKFALEGFTESVAFELGSQNIFVKSVIPHGGVAQTNFSSKAVGLAEGTPESYVPFVENTAEAFGKMTAARSIGAADVAEVVYGAATDGAEKLRYFVGNDTRGFIKARYESKSDDEYITHMRSFFL
ncbi:hypothetical protein DXG01_008223 [Tephrocybe rancida]|nr:hypothetical protein DXG01_008223 [Tephrocybe rancida]